MYDVGRAQLRSCAEGEGASPIRGFGAKVATRVPARCGETDASIYSESRSSHIAACEPRGGFRTAVTDRIKLTATAAAERGGAGGAAQARHSEGRGADVQEYRQCSLRRCGKIANPLTAHACMHARMCARQWTAHGSGGLRGPRVLQDPFIAPQYDNSVGFLSLPFIR